MQAGQGCGKYAGHSSSTYGKGLLRAGSDGPRYLSAGNECMRLALALDGWWPRQRALCFSRGFSWERRMRRRGKSTMGRRCCWSG